MTQTRILDSLIQNKIPLEVDALSTDPKKPLRLNAILVDYDDRGYLLKAAPSKDCPTQSADKTYYVPTSALARFVFSSAEYPQNLGDNSRESKLSAGTVDTPKATYDNQSKILQYGALQQHINNEMEQIFLRLLFEAGEEFVGFDTFVNSNPSGTPYKKGGVYQKLTAIRSLLKPCFLNISRWNERGYKLIPL
ncbi:MAG: hypothetical protein Q7K43_05940 [Candidatus Woesearchaeota archaeon]|nr:hypothetical protein [Candidatus Woesearchaeota archaeon]